MRYRPLGASGIAISTVTLALYDRQAARAADWTALVYAALENGINSFEIVGGDPAILDGLAAALQSVSRRLLIIGLRLGAQPDGRRDFTGKFMSTRVQAVVARLGVDYLDIVSLDDPRSEEFSPADLNTLKEIKRAGRVQMLGVRGAGEAIDAYISTGAFDILSIPFNMTSGWRERHRIRLAQEREMGIVGYDYFPDAIRERGDETAAEPARRGWLRKSEPALHAPGYDAYGFLYETPAWTPEEICLAYALTEPSLATVEIAPADADTLAGLAEAPDRDLPAGLGSRVEMARFSAAKSQGGGKA